LYGGIDDVLKYIGPTLARHKGCDILDLNPGVGLWSRKLHDFLQPRSHVLLDSSPETWDRWIRPLLEGPRSTYKSIQGDVTLLETFDRLVREGIFPHQKRRDSRDLDCQQPNDSLLITGTLIWEPKLPGFGFDSMSKQMLLQFAEQAWRNKIFHAFGPVRSLLWTSYDKSIIPRSVFQRAKYDFFLDALSINTEVVTPGHPPRQAGRATIGREPQHEIESLVCALRRGKEKGMTLPAHRRENVHDFADDITNLTDGTGIMSAVDMQQYLKLQEFSGKSTTGISMETHIESYKFDKALKEDPNTYKIERKKGSAGGHYRVSDVGKKASTLRASVTRNKKIRHETEKIADLAEDIYKLECKILSLKDGAEKDVEHARLQVLEDELTAGTSKVLSNYQAAIQTEIDDRLAIRSPVPRLAWDSRPYEPLVMNPEEAWPVTKVSLIDLTPRSLPPGKSPDWYDWLQDFTVGLMEQPTLSVHQALENVQHGASDLIAKAPSLTDPKRGGRLNMHHLRVRMLTVEMVDELCQAYREWPFRNPEANHTRYFRLQHVKSR
jgi:transcription factor 1